MTILIKLFLIFLKIGLFSFGGGYAMLPIIYNDIQTFGLMDPSEFSDIIAISQVTPGAIAINTATFVGFKAAGFWGALTAAIGISLPSIVLILVVSTFFKKFKSSPVVGSAFYVIRPATIGMIFSAGFILLGGSVIKLHSDTGFFANASKVFSQPFNYINFAALAIFASSIFLIAKLKINPILLILIAGIVGAVVI